MSIGPGAGIDALIKLRHLLIDRREQRRWFIRWRYDAAVRTLPPGMATGPAIEARAKELGEWAEGLAKARRRDDDVEETGVLDPRFLLLQHICWAFDTAGTFPEAEALLAYTDREFEAAGPFGDAPPGGFGSEKGM